MTTKNKFSAIELAIREIVEGQGQAKNWADGATAFIVQDDEQLTCWVRADVLEESLTTAQLAALVEEDLLENDGKPMRKRSGSKYAAAYGVRLEQLHQKAQRAEREASTVHVLTRQVSDLQRELKAAREAKASELAMADLLGQLSSNMEKYFPKKSTRAAPSPAWLKPQQGAKTAKKALAGVPTLFLSDWHWAENVDPRQVENLNEFNLEIAEVRGRRVVSQAMELLFHHQAGQTYEGICVALGGDMLSGNIHEELRRTNSVPIIDAVMSLAMHLTDSLLEIAENFESVYVPCVVGNHGRLDHKPIAKGNTKENFDYQVYQMVEAMVRARMGDKCNVEFGISSSSDIRYSLYGTKYLLTHGDQIKGGSGVGSFWPSMMKVAHRKQERAVRTPEGGFDYMLCGHFHKYGSVSNIIVNGSLKGYDEWVYRMNFEFQLPIQALWTTHPVYGIISHMPIYAEQPIVDERVNLPPVSPSEHVFNFSEEVNEWRGQKKAA